MSASSVVRSCRLVTHATKQSLRSVRSSFDPRLTVGFVPTMGALHEGHISLVRQARAENDIVLASIFVNPTQFGPNEDLDKYPRQLDRDIELLEEAGVDHLFVPDAGSMYGRNHVTFVDPTGFDNLPEGIVRPGHFRGVATIVTKLFNIVQPTNAYFGQKDAAQCVLIRRIVEDLDMPVTIVIHETIREADGLALSSRNVYLTAEERKAAPILYRSLCSAKALLESASSLAVSSTELMATVQQVLQREPLVSKVEYVSVDSKETMLALNTVTKETGAVISIACRVGSVRLIDNIVL